MADILCTPFVFTPLSTSSDQITGDIRHTRTIAQHSAIVLIVHGFKGFKDWGFFPYVAEHLAQKGFITITFNFSLNGYCPGSDVIEFPEKFEHNTISREIEEVSAIINALRSGNLNPSLAPFSHNPLHLLGHSRGGGVTILTSSLSSEIKSSAVWNSVATFDRFTQRQKDKWREEGGFPVENARTGQKLRIGLPYLDDITNNSYALSVTNSIAKINIPLLIVHSEQDVTVPVREAHKLRESSSANTRLHIIPRTGHTFGIVHPFEGSTNALEEALAVTMDFFKQ